jgi:LysR family transcriptional regulator for bpeEF and oprC
VINLNDLRVFERVAALRNFSAAGRALGVPKSTVSRCVMRLETELGVRLIQRSTHTVRLTEPGLALKRRCLEIFAHVNKAIDDVSSASRLPKGTLKINATIGFGYSVLSETLLTFLERYPDIDVSLELTSRPVDIVAEGIDAAIRIGHLPDSRLIATGLGSVNKYLCASPLYLKRRGQPQSIKSLKDHDTIESTCHNDGIPRTWQFCKNGVEIHRFDVSRKLLVNDPGMVHRLVLKGAGIASLPGFWCAPDFETGRLIRLFPEWTMPPVEVNILYPSRRGLSPAVRAFVEHMKQSAEGGKLWMHDPIAKGAHSPPLLRHAPNRSRAQKPA